MFDRRTFLAVMTQLLAAHGWSKVALADEAQTQRDRLGEWMPARVLGRTGEPVTMLGLGGYHFGKVEETEAQAMLEAALEGGLRFIDSAVQYQNGGSEERMGRLITPKYREEVFLMTKSQAKDAKGVRQELEDSLRRLKTDYLDLWQIHAIDSPEDVDERLDNGVLDAFLQAKEEGKTRYIGFTGHRNYKAHLRILERTKDSDPFDACQMPINVLDPAYASYIVNVMPKLEERNIGILAMKTLAFGNLLDKSRETGEGAQKVVPDVMSLEEALHFVWSQPVATVISGMESVAHFQENAGYARSWKPMDEEARQALLANVAEFAGNEWESYKA